METVNANQQLPPVQNTEPPQTPPNPSGLSKTFIIVLGVVLVLMLGIGNYVLGTRKNQTVIQNQITASPTISQPLPTPTPDETANWKTYTNTFYKYSLKYPPDYSIRVRNAEDNPAESALLIFYNKTDDNNIQVYVRVEPPIKTSLNQWVNDNFLTTTLKNDQTIPAKVSKVPIASYDALLVRTKAYDINQKPIPHYNAFIEKDKNTIITLDGNEPLLDQILSTFKFIQ